MKITTCILAVKSLFIFGCSSGFEYPEYEALPIYTIVVKYTILVNGTPLTLIESVGIDWRNTSKEFMEKKKWELTVTNVRKHYSMYFANAGTIHFDRSITEGGVPIYSIINEIEIKNGECFRNITDQVDIKAKSKGVLIESEYGKYMLTHNRIRRINKLISDDNIKISVNSNIVALDTYDKMKNKWSKYTQPFFTGFRITKKVELGFLYWKTYDLYSCISPQEK